MTLSLMQFLIFGITSLGAFLLIVRYVLRERTPKVSFLKILALGILICLGGMIFAKAGAQAGWPWWIYYPVPMLATVFLPPVYFRMKKQQVFVYLILSFLSAPAIHLFYSFFLGWDEYMPFIKIPALWEL